MQDTPTHISHEKATIASLKRDPAFTAVYLTTVLTDGDRPEAQLALSRINEAYAPRTPSSPGDEYQK